MFGDFIFIFQWWLLFFLIGLIFLPAAIFIFNNFFDKGYIFSKIIGLILISYSVYFLGSLKILAFSQITIFFTSLIFLAINYIILLKILNIKFPWRIFIFEELIFFITLFLWSYIRSFQPDIHGLEKYMDFGFVNTILRSDYFPPKDMWFYPFPINYYYFGHLFTAVLTKISGMPSFITYNLMIASLFAFTFTGAFSIGSNLLYLKLKEQKGKANIRILIGGLLSALLVSLAGNLHAIYTFFKSYSNENPVPFWQLDFSPLTLISNSYWYPNATRFIYNTIHEFPIYSFVVSDLHGHVLDIPVVLLTIATLLSLMFLPKKETHLIQNAKFKMQNENLKFKVLKLLPFNFYLLTFLAFLLAVMYMTNVWDSVIYFLLAFFVFSYLQIFGPKQYKIKPLIVLAICLLIIGAGFFIFSLPFSINFKPFASGIGILCAPSFLTDIEKIGPFLFEADHCQKSPFWQLAILYGFFYFWVIFFFFWLFSKSKVVQNSKCSPRKAGKMQNYNSTFEILNFKLPLLTLNFEFLTVSDIFILLLIFLSTLLIIIPEFIYIKDIYPAHYRANTMFKLAYQSFIMLSISSGYIMIKMISNIKQIIKFEIRNYWKILIMAMTILTGIIGLVIVLIYPSFAIKSYYGEFKTYRGLDGTSYLKNLYPTDYEAILWINNNIDGQPVILEAQGDSYTDYARISSNTGLPTILGWTVHEWLWRGKYDIPSPRISEVKILYENSNLSHTKELLKKYHVSLVFIGDLERMKYQNLNEQKFEQVGKIIYQNGRTKIYKINL